MMTPEEARARQAQVVAALPDLFVRACPGAGKTRTVVDRFLRVADSAIPRAAAVISFTNRAADEVSKRCIEMGRPDLADFPHFVGTFDRFLATYIVRPFGQLEGPIRIVDSWSSLDVMIAGTGGRPVSLERFVVSPDGILRFEPAQRDPRLQGSHLARREQAARARLDQLRNDGYLTCDDARAYALRLIKDHPRIAMLLRERFVEIIVDEAQDCSAAELDILDELRTAGLPVVVVCDPHQSIYEWRDADPKRLAQFTASLQCIELDGNWRSSPAICALAATLTRGSPDHPVGPHRNNTTPIHVIRYSGNPGPALGARFLELIGNVGLEERDAVVLAHSAGPAARAVGAGLAQSAGNAVVLASSVTRIADERTGSQERQRESDRLQRVVLRYMRVGTEGQTTERAVELAAFDSTWLRTTTTRLIHTILTLDLDMTATDWVSAARDALASIDTPAGIRPVPAGNFLRVPSGAASRTMRQAIAGQTASVRVAHSSIHQAKGTQSPAVLVVIPPDRAPSTRSQSLVSAWEAGEDIEAKRVLYVGVTRAEQICVLALPGALAERVENFLNDCEIPLESSAS